MLVLNRASARLLFITLSAISLNSKCLLFRYVSELYGPVATGCFGGVSPPHKDPTSPYSNMIHYDSLQFLSNFQNVKTPAQTSSPPNEDLLETLQELYFGKWHFVSII